MSRLFINEIFELESYGIGVAVGSGVSVSTGCVVTVGGWVTSSVGLGVADGSSVGVAEGGSTVGWAGVAAGGIRLGSAVEVGVIIDVTDGVVVLGRLCPASMVNDFSGLQSETFPAAS